MKRVIGIDYGTLSECAFFLDTENNNEGKGLNKYIGSVFFLQNFILTNVATLVILCVVATSVITLKLILCNIRRTKNVNC